jgi:hypothetical protein
MGPSGSFFVIAFASYVEEQSGSGFAQSFSDWLKSRTEITKCVCPASRRRAPDGARAANSRSCASRTARG